MLFAGISFVVAAIIATLASAAGTGTNTDLVQKLKMAITNMDKLNLLPKDSDWFFDFTKSDDYTFSPGGVVYADAATFAATIGTGMSMVSRPVLSQNDANVRRLPSTLVLAPCFHPTSTLELPNTLSLSKAQPIPS